MHAAAIRRCTKLVATIGPSTNTLPRLRGIIDAGVDVVRLNFSHGTHDEHASRIALVRQAAEESGRHVALLQDLCGPKIRTAKHAGDGAPLKLPTGGKLTIVSQPDVLGYATSEGVVVGTTYEALASDVSPGDTILISDGNINVKCVEVVGDELRCEVIHGGMLKSSQGLNLPGVDLSTAALTDKDIQDLEFGLEQDLDFVALSFVRSADDVKDLRGHMKRLGKKAPIISKIEMPQALTNLSEIVKESNGIMVARGDLGVELPPELVPIAQKRIISLANEHGIPVIVATQMLESMITTPRPTRAEVSDVTNAIFDGADACMLSAESAAGEFPLESVNMMSRIAEVAASHGDVDKSIVHQAGGLHTHSTLSQAAGHAATTFAKDIKASFIVTYTHSGQAALGISRHSPTCPVIAMTTEPAVCRRLNLTRNVFPILVPVVHTAMEATMIAERELMKAGLVKRGDRIVITTGHPVMESFQETNAVKVHEIGSIIFMEENA